MVRNKRLDKIAIGPKSHRLLLQLLNENQRLKEIMYNARNETEALVEVKNWVFDYIKSRPNAYRYYKGIQINQNSFQKLNWSDYAAIRILDYIDNAGREFVDLNLSGEKAISNPIRILWLSIHKGVSGAKSYFFQDMLELFRQFTGRNKLHLPSKETVKKWMERYPSGLDPHIIKFREENRERIINIIIDKIEKGEINKPKYSYLKKMTREQKFLAILDLWNDKSFHIHFAIRSPEQLNEFLGGSLNREKMKILMSAKKAGLPFFVNLYYLSLLNVRIVPSSIGADLAVRDYIIYNRQLIKEFGRIVAWEKEDKVQPGKPNAAGWILPLQYNIHRRYPEVAIMIPDTMGRACGGLCTSCQRMFDFQKGVLNFDLEKLKPKKPWDKKLKIIMDYFVNDSQIRDVLITGGDALMSSDESLKNILENVFDMALSKKERNEQRKNGEKYAEIIRVRLGTRLLAYLPQRITPKLIKILTDFKFNAQKIGIKQFIIQAHFESPIEVTPEAREAVSKLISSGWMVTNQLVFTTSASRRGHTAKLRQVLNEIGVITYYSFSVKGFKENNYNFATIARSVQEQIEEKSIGKIPESKYNSLKQFSLKPTEIVENIKHLKNEAKIPFLSTDRNVLNLPGVGKSLTFRVIGITRYGRRILEFDHDPTRSHSPIIKKMGKVIIVESKSISEYLKQLDAMGEDISEYKDVYGYSLGVTEPRMQIFDYPEYNFKITDKITNLKID